MITVALRFKSTRNPSLHVRSTLYSEVKRSSVRLEIDRQRELSAARLVAGSRDRQRKPKAGREIAVSGSLRPHWGSLAPYLPAQLRRGIGPSLYPKSFIARLSVPSGWQGRWFSDWNHPFQNRRRGVPTPRRVPGPAREVSKFLVTAKSENVSGRGWGVLPIGRCPLWRRVAGLEPTFPLNELSCH